jgi:hypothetical protein
MDEKIKLGQLKICVEKMLKKHDTSIEKLKQNSINTQHFNKLRAAFLTQFMWKKNDVITIGFMGTGENIKRNTYEELSRNIGYDGQYIKVDPLQKKVDKLSVIDGIKIIVNERIQPLAGLKFEFVDDYKEANVKIDFNPAEGAWSLIGNQCLDEEVKENSTMNLGWFDVPTTIHEFGHVLGLIHEHQNVKDNPIKWDEDAVYKWAASTQGWDKKTTDINILQKYDKTQINGTIFDPLSIMLYFFPAELTLNNKGTRQNLRLSGYDVQFVNQSYPGSSETPEEFYVKVYKETLESNIELSQQILKTGGVEGDYNHKNIFNFTNIGYILLGLLIGILIYRIFS